MRKTLERYFEFERLGTNWRNEILAGCTTFVTMAYIIFVNPSILAETGMPVKALIAATCLSAGLASILMGAYARYPIALAPGMGLNAYFAYAVVKGMGVAWEVALGAVFLSGAAFVVLTLSGIREKIVTAIPADLYASVAVGIGLFIALIGLRNAGLIRSDPSTMVTLGNLHDPHTVLSLSGLLLIATLHAYGFSAALLVGILATTAAGAVVGLIPWQPQAYALGEITATAFRLDIAGALKLGVLEIVFVFLFVDLFDNIGTLVAVGKKANLFDPNDRIPRVNRILLTDATATVAGSLAGTSTVVSYIESAAGLVAGGRSGFTAVVVGLLFLLALLVAPLAGAIPVSATAPALIMVGAVMIGHAREVKWDDPLVALPAFLTMTSIPLTFSIANGLAIGFTSYTLVHILRGRFHRLNGLMYVLTALFLIRFVYLRHGG